jgi:hypothetical protein
MKKLFMFSLLMSVLVLTFSAGETDASSQESAPLLKEKPAMNSGGSIPSLSGKVVETMNSGGYTYVNIDKEGTKTWLAVPQMKITVGQDMSFYPGMTMKNFTSKSLDRTFDRIIFSRGVVGQQEKESKKTFMNLKKATPSKSTAVKVEKASGPDAYTVAELYEKSTELDTKNVVFRGKAVKFSQNIMGKNWIHIQDGSGNPSKGTNDILVTTQDKLSEGDVVTIQGTLSRDKDFGAGYRYAVIVEDAHVKK